MTRAITKQNKNNWKAIKCRIFIILYNSNISHSFALKKMAKTIQVAKNTWNWAFLISLSTPPCQQSPESKIKTIQHAFPYDTLIALCNSNICYFLNEPKAWVRPPNGWKYLKMVAFHKIEYSFLPTSTTKQIKNHRGRNYIWHSYHFMQF